MRDNYSDCLIALKAKYPEMVVLDADCSTSTTSKKFGEEYTEYFFNIGIAEQNMVAIAAGMALKNKIPVVNAFSKMLVMRAFEQIHDLIGLQNIKVILVGHYAGVSPGLEGVSHHSLNDIGLMRMVPNLTIYTPGNDLEIRLSLTRSVASTSGSYIRLSKNKACHVDESSVLIKSGFTIMDNQTSICRKRIVLISIGSMFEHAKMVTRKLKEKNYTIMFLSLWCLDSEAMESLCDLITNDDFVVVVEEHSEVGGAGELIESYLNRKQIFGNLLKLNTGINIGDTGSYDYLLEQMGISMKQIEERIEEGWSNIE